MMSTDKDAILLWVADKKIFLKIQKGARCVLDGEDVAKGVVDCVSWNIFEPNDIGAGESWNPLCVRGGLLKFEEETSVGDSVGAVYKAAFGYDLPLDGSAILLHVV